MSLPIIDQITVAPPVIRECESTIITVMARETVTGTVVLKLAVRNELGQAILRDVEVQLTGSGLLTYDLIETPVPGRPLGEIFQDPDRPNVFTYVAACPDNPSHVPGTHGSLPVEQI